jgi:hypothetical protein
MNQVPHQIQVLLVQNKIVTQTALLKIKISQKKLKPLKALRVPTNKKWIYLLKNQKIKLIFPHLLNLQVTLTLDKRQIGKRTNPPCNKSTTFIDKLLKKGNTILKI